MRERINKTESKLKTLFDAQKFFHNPKLDALIEEQSAVPLDDDDIELIFAAGDTAAETDKKDDGSV